MEKAIVKVISVGPLQANCYLYGSTESGNIVVIDPGDEPERILNEIDRLSLKVSAIINTHGHFDHAAGNLLIKEKTGAPILVHHDDAVALTSISHQAGFFGFQRDNSPPADRLLEDNDTINLADLSLTVIHTPGHTPGGISLKGPGLVFSGDTLFAGSIGRTDLPGGSFEKMMASIRSKLLTLPDDVLVYPGHGPVTTIGEEKFSNPFLI